MNHRGAIGTNLAKLGLGLETLKNFSPRPVKAETIDVVTAMKCRAIREKNQN